MIARHANPAKEKDLQSVLAVRTAGSVMTLEIPAAPTPEQCRRRKSQEENGRRQAASNKSHHLRPKMAEARKAKAEAEVEAKEKVKEKSKTVPEIRKRSCVGTSERAKDVQQEKIASTGITKDCSIRRPTSTLEDKKPSPPEAKMPEAATKDGEGPLGRVSKVPKSFVWYLWEKQDAKPQVLKVSARAKQRNMES